MQVVGQFLGRDVAVRRILAERFENDDLQFRRNAAIDGTRRARVAVKHVGQQRLTRPAREDG